MISAEMRSGRWTASLPMYDLPEVRADVDQLWAAIRRRLSGVGLVPPATLARPRDLHRSWADRNLLLSQTCGYPLVAALGQLAVVGTFAASSDEPVGWYRSVIVSASTGRPGRDAAGERVGCRWAVNDSWSLSGWISLLATLDDAGDHAIVVTGSHRASIRALVDGTADVASIDAVTFGLLADHAPGELAGVRVVGRGPSVPCLPLVTADSRLVPVLRSVLADVVADSELTATRRRFHVDSFVPLDRSDYRVVAELARAVGPTEPPSP